MHQSHARALCAALSITAFFIVATGIAAAQTYPARPIRIITTVPGSGTDLVARMLAQGLTSALGQQAVVDNRGIVGIETAAKAAPDGYTLLLYTSPLWLTPVFRNDVSWDVLRDFTPIMSPTTTPNVLVVHPSVAAKSVQELIAYAKAKPGALNYASGSTAASAHIAAELFKSMAGVDFVRVNFKGTGPALTALLGGEVQVMFPAAGSVTPHVKAGKLRALAVTSAQPSALAPGLPTVAAAGLPGYESSSLTGIFAPAKTPSAIVNRLNDEMGRTLGRPDVKERLFVSGLEVIALPPAEFTKFIRTEVARMEKMVKSAGLRE
ncbi:MAG TPA: tripartite tricarboxylate transporter substrate binding protein [Burkholderiales bacterium]|jgi:tripartite-type tricarboxylate transporter receptor subunit TctC|nr:tripartite tricarboxylate transporter substrate binding protein [Burkholderiales bacterium]